VRAYVDVTISEKLTGDQVAEFVKPLAYGMHAQYPAIVLTEPEMMGTGVAGDGGWSFLRVKFRIWPGQGALIEGGFRDRTLAKLMQLDPEYAPWMISVTYRAE
jgi:small conductance mechanosensitive channel